MNVSADFEKQFDNRDFVGTSFGRIETVDIKPQKIKSSIPILFAPGWRETPELQKECLREVYDSGRRVITFVDRKKRVVRETVREYPEVELEKAKTIHEVLETKGVKKVDVITHSEGALNVTIAATLKPEQFRNLVLIAPAGLSGVNSTINITIGFIKHMIRGNVSSVIKRHMQTKPHRETLNILQNIFLALKEVNAIAKFDIHPLLIELKKKNVHVAVLVGENDTVFPFAKVKSHLLKLSKELNFGFDIFATKSGGHELYSKPHEIMPQVEEMLKELEK